MGLSPRIVTETRLILWDGVTQRLPKGQVMDVPPGSPLEAAIGAEFLVPMPGAEAQAPEAAAVFGAGRGGAANSTAFGGGGGGEFASAPLKPRAAAKKQDNAKEGS
jgi:hypothetical protein